MFVVFIHIESSLNYEYIGLQAVHLVTNYFWWYYGLNRRFCYLKRQDGQHLGRSDWKTPATRRLTPYLSVAAAVWPADPAGVFSVSACQTAGRGGLQKWRCQTYRCLVARGDGDAVWACRTADPRNQLFVVRYQVLRRYPRYLSVLRKRNQSNYTPCYLWYHPVILWKCRCQNPGFQPLRTKTTAAAGGSG